MRKLIYQMLRNMSLMMLLILFIAHIFAFLGIYTEKFFIISTIVLLIFSIPCLWIIPKNSIAAKEWGALMVKDTKRKILFIMVIIYFVSIIAFLEYSGLLNRANGTFGQGDAIIFAVFSAVWFFLISSAYNYGINKIS